MRVYEVGHAGYSVDHASIPEQCSRRKPDRC